MRLKTRISTLFSTGARLRVGSVLMLLVLFQLSGISQPAVLYTSLTTTTPVSNNNRWALNDRGVFRQFRFQSNQADGNFYWAFSLGTPASPDYSICWRPYTSLNVMAYNTYIPVGWANGARYNTTNGGNDGEINAIQNGYYYTFNVTENAAADNIMAVMETSFNPKTMVLTDAPAPYGDRTATVTLSAAPSSGEYVYIRYTTDNYVNSTIIPVSFVGNIGTATVPVPNANGVTQKYYAYSSNKPKAQIDAEVVLYSSQVPHDMYTLELSNGESNTFTNQVVVTSTGGTLMSTYPTMKDAFTAINGGVNHTGTITIALIGNTVETASAVLNASGTGAPPSSYVSVGIQPAGGLARIISGTLTSGPMIDLNGADNVTINGNPAGGSPLLMLRNNSATPGSTSADIRFYNGSSLCILTNCDVENNGTAAAAGNILVGSGTNSVTISNNNIHDPTAGPPGKPYNAVNSYTSANSLSITNNNIYNWTNFGINATTAANGCTITGNSFYMTGVATAATQTAIYVNAGSGHAISNNFIGGQAPLCGGGAWTNSADVDFTGIYLNVGGTATSVQGNTFQNISLTSTNSNASGSLIHGIQINAGLVNVGTITGNILGHSTTPGSILIAGTNTTLSSSILIDGGSSALGSNFENNLVANFSYSGNGTVYLYGIKLNGNARKNKIYNIGSTTAGATPFIIGIDIAGDGGGECSNNFIALSGGSATNPKIHGIYSRTVTIYNIYYNSVNITGPATTTQRTFALYRVNTTSALIVKNNILVNKRIAGGTGKHYAVYIESNLIGTWTSNYNDFYSADPLYVAYYPSAPSSSFIDYQSGSGQDANSVNVAPVFTSNTDLHLVTSSNDGIDKKGTPIGSVTTDIDGAARDATTPDIGADEFVSTSCSPVTGGTASGTTTFCGSGTPVITASGYSVVTGTTYQWQYSNDNFSHASDVAGQVNPAALSIGPVTISTWYRLRVTCPAAFDTGYSTVAAVTIKTVPGSVTVAPVSATICNGIIQQLVASGGSLPSTILNENFNTGTNSWTKINNSTLGTPENAAWTLRPDGYSYSGTWHSNDNTQFYLSNSDAQGSGGLTATILQSPAFSTVGYSAATLSFYHYYRHGFVDLANVDISSDGTTWTNLDSYTSDQGAMAAFAHPSYSLPAPFLNQATVYIRFTYNAPNQHYWGIDDVSITGTPASPTITWTPTTALFTNAGATIPYAGGTNLTTVYAKPAATTTYTATSTSPAGCTSSIGATITVPVPVATITPAGPVSFCTGGSTVLTASVNSGYLWSTGATTQSITVNTAGTYTVTVTDGNGCKTVSAGKTVTESLCATVTLIPELCGLSPGDILVVHVFVTGPNIGLTDLTLDFDPLLLSEVIPAPGYANLHPDFGYEMEFFSPGSYSFYCEKLNLAIVTPLNGTMVDLRFIYNGVGANSINITSCQILDNLSLPVTVTSTGCTITPLPLPTPTITTNGPTTFCAGGTVTLTAGGGTNYLWSNSETAAAIVVSTSGIYTVTVTDAAGCSKTTSQTVTVNPLPTALITPDGPTTFCDGGSVVLSTSANAGYIWSTGATTRDITATTAGSYAVTVTDVNGCTAVSAATVVTVIPCATVTLEPDLASLCEGNTLTVHVKVTGTSVFHLMLYLDFLPAVLTSTGSGNEYTGFTSFTMEPAGPGSLFVDIEGTSNTNFTNETVVDLFFTYNGGITNITFSGLFTSEVRDIWNNLVSTTFVGASNVTGFSKPVAMINPPGPTAICAGGSVVLTASGGTSYLWSNAAITPAITVTIGGTYTVTVTDANGCSNTASRTVTVNSLPTATITPPGPTAICAGGSVVLTASGGTSYFWSNAAITQAITVTTGGTYTVTVTDANGCSNTASRTVTVNSLPTATITPPGPTAICAGGSVVLTASGGTSYLWSNAAITPAITVTTGGTYTVTVTDANGCTNTANRLVSVIPVPSITLGSNPSVCEGALFTNLSYTAISGSPDQYSIVWSPAAIAAGFGNVPNTLLPASPITITVPGAPANVYTGTLTVTNSTTGCTSIGYPISVTINPTPSITPGSIPSVCQGITVANLTYSATSGAPDQYSIIWNLPAPANGFVNVTNAALPASPIVLAIPAAPAAGTYSATLTVRNSSTGCVSSGTVIFITIDPSPTITLGPDPSVCIGTTTANLPYSATTGTPNQYSIVWSGAAIGAGFTNVTNGALPASPIILVVPGAAPAAVYTATLTVTNSTTGCTSGTYVISVTVNSLPTITPGSNPSVCIGTTTANLPYSATAGTPNQYSIVWSGAALGVGFLNVTNVALPASPIVLVVPGAAPAATYSATLTVTNSTTGCTSGTYAISVTVNPLPVTSPIYHN